MSCMDCSRARPITMFVAVLLALSGACLVPGNRGARRSRPAAGREHRRLGRQGNVCGSGHSAGQHTDLRRARWRHPGGRQTAAGGHLQHKGLLQGSVALVRSALLPLQLAGGTRADLGRIRSAADRQRSAAHGSLGFLRPGLSAQADRQPLSLQDGEGALRRIAGRRATARWSDGLYARLACRTGTASTCATRPRPPPGTTARCCRFRPISRCSRRSTRSASSSRCTTTPATARRSGQVRTAGPRGSCAASRSTVATASTSWSPPT